MRVGTSGTRELLTRAQRAFIAAKIASLAPGTTVVTGGCVGVDAYIAELAHMLGYLKVHTILPSDHKAVDPHWRRHCDTYTQMPPGTGYGQRNRAIVECGDRLLAFPMYREFVIRINSGDPRSRRSGTWMTVRIARQAGKAVEAFVLDDIDLSDWT